MNSAKEASQWNNMTFCMGITLYNPEDETFSYIQEMQDAFSYVYIYDNSSDNSPYSDKLHNSIYKYHFEKKNNGLSKAFNWFLDEAVADKADYLLLLDQDSFFDANKMKALMKEIESFGFDDSVAIRACDTKPIGYDAPPLPEAITNEDNRAIASGSFINIHAVTKHKLRFDENIFLDHVDHDFCNEVLKKGLKIICHNRYLFYQQLGYRHNGVICHSPIRHYYMVRDVGYMNRKNYSPLQTIIKSFFSLMGDLKHASKEDNPKEKKRYARRGFRDYLHHVTGEYKER